LRAGSSLDMPFPVASAYEGSGQLFLSKLDLKVQSTHVALHLQCVVLHMLRALTLFLFTARYLGS